MTNETGRWTSDHLLNQTNGITIYKDQIRQAYRGDHDGFRVLANEVQDDLRAKPPAGDNTIQAWWHARRVSRHLKSMAKHAQGIVADAQKLEQEYQRTYVDLPKDRQNKAEAKALQKAAQAQLPGQTAPSVNGTATSGLTWGAGSIPLAGRQQANYAPDPAEASADLPFNAIDLFRRAQ